ncbi:MAG TPA: BatD family protein [Verrucomicrobiae bacterium]|nr:BatD family protein [Verrucomicrobiae bacterium]
MGPSPKNRLQRKGRWVLLVWIAWWIGHGLGADLLAASFRTSLDRNVVPMGETVTLNLTFAGATPNGTPNLPALPNLQVIGTSYTSQAVIENGQQNVEVTYSYSLAPRQPGEVTIPAMQAIANGQTLTSQPLTLKIVPSNTPGASANPAPAMVNLAFVRLIVPKTEVYVGEPFPVEIHLYWQAAEDIHMPQLRAEGFSLSQMPQPGKTRTQVGNGIYDLAIFKCTATAARSGNLTFGPVEEQLKILIPIPNQRRTRDPFFDPFFGGPRYQPFPTNLTSESVAMRVLDLPAQNIPENFNGAIGSYEMSASAGPTNVGVGDPITVRVQISGRGPIESLTLPPQPQWRDFTSYPATAKVETSDALGLAGTKSFEQVLVPQNHEINALPPVQFSFFDPSAKAYRTLRGPAVPLLVRPAAMASAPPPSLTNTTQSGTPPADDIVHIKPRLDPAAVAAPLLLSRPWFLVLQSVPPLLWVSLLVWRKRNESLANNPRLRRQREVAVRIRAGLKELRTQADQRQAEGFFANLFRLLQEQLGERLDLPASAITEAVIDERLRARAISPGTLQSLHDLFQTCNLARYAPMQTSQELTALIPKLESVLRELQQLKA